MNSFGLIFKYIQYFFLSKGRLQVHSPFLEDFLDHVLYAKSDKKRFTEIERLRNGFLKDNSTIEIQDFGAGSKVNSSKRRKIKSIARHSLKPQKFAHLIHRLVNYYQPDNILELGTSLGISTLYISDAHKESNITTVEGCPETARLAGSAFNELKAENIQLVNEAFDQYLEEYLQSVETIDMVFFDGNHRKEATLVYFEQCLGKINPQTIFVFDDIRWSTGMEEAWEIIKANPKTKLCLDLFSMGLVFFREEVSQENVLLKF